MWQHFLGPLPNGDCVGMTIAATIIAYPVALSMIIRWRWVRPSILHLVLLLGLIS